MGRYTLMQSLYRMVTTVPFSGCHVSLASACNGGYAQIWFERKRYYVHRLSYELHNGPIPKGIEVCHTCDVPSCINPSHLFLGTHKENMQDRAAKKRGCRGGKHHWSKLTEADVANIRAERAAGKTLRQIAPLFGVTHSAISAIVIGRTWK